MIIELDEKNFEQEISHGLRVIEFYTTWCTYCKNQRIELIDFENSDIRIGIVDAEECPKLAQKYSINGYPTFLVFKNGELVKTIDGFHKKNQLLNELLNL